MAGHKVIPRIVLFGGHGGRSGVPRHLHQLCETLNGTAKLTVVSNRNSGGYDQICHTGARHIEVAGLHSTLDPRNLWRGWIAALRIARAGHWDVLWLHARLPALLLRVALACTLLRLPSHTQVIMSYHGIPFDPGHRRLAARVSRWIERLLLTHCPPMHLVVLTQDMATRLEAAVGRARLERHWVHILANSSNLGRFPPGRDGRNDRRLVITGRAGYQKNYELAVRLMEHMPPDYSLTLCGTGTDDLAFQTHLLRQVGPATRTRIHFAGPLCDVRPLLAEADGYLLTSRYEGLPIGAIEAFECGLPLILGPFEGAPGMVSGHPMAICVPLRDLSRDAGRITALVENYCHDRASGAERIRTAWHRAYPYDRWQKQVRALMCEVLNQPKTPGKADEIASTQDVTSHLARLRSCRSSASSRSS